LRCFQLPLPTPRRRLRDKLFGFVHFLFTAHSGSPQVHNVHPTASAAGTDFPGQNNDWLFVPVAKANQLTQRFAFPGAVVHPAFSGHHNVRLLDLFIQPNEAKKCVRPHFKPRVRKPLEPCRRSPRRTGSWDS
jgi:hypothetical protein